MPQIKHNTDLTRPNLTNSAFPTLTLPGQPYPAPSQVEICSFLHAMPVDFFKKLPKFGKINLRTAKVSNYEYASTECARDCGPYEVKNVGQETQTQAGKVKYMRQETQTHA